MTPKIHSSLLVAGVACMLAASGPAAAQSSETQQLLNRIERLQQEMTTLQRFVYRGEKPPAPAAAAPVDANSRTMVARMSLRISQLEGEIRRLTGRNEEFGHAISQMQARLEKMAQDVEFRLGALERGGAPAQPGMPGAPAAAMTAPGGMAPTAAPAPNTPAPPPAAPGTLGTLRTDAAGKPLPPAAPSSAAPAPAQQQAALPTAETAQQQYDRAHALIVKDQNFAEAERVLKAFIEAHPKHELTPNAHYWLGRTYFVRQDFPQAAYTFAEGVQKFPKAEKAPANLLNLGMSLARMGKDAEACTAYARLLQSFPGADAGVKRRVASEQQRAKCR
jgi:tol-pal system protein YbgF